MKTIHQRPARSLGLILALMAVASAAPGPALAASVAPAPTPAEAKTIAAEAWLYAYAPLQDYQNLLEPDPEQGLSGLCGRLQPVPSLQPLRHSGRHGHRLP